MSKRNRLENTTYCTAMFSSGFRKLQNTPSTERLYFALKSRSTSCLMRKRYFCMAVMAFTNALGLPFCQRLYDHSRYAASTAPKAAANSQ